MLRVARILPAVLVLVTSAALAGGSDDRADPSALVTALTSGDVRARQEAAERIFDRGPLTIERVARRAGEFDEAAWTAFADAFVHENWAPYAVVLVAAAHGAPETVQRRIIDVARRLDARAGTTPNPEELAAVLHKVLVEERGLQDAPFPREVAIYGHAGVAPVLTLLRENGSDVVDYDRASSVLKWIAQPEDLPALRELLLAGKSSAAAALVRLGELGVAGAPAVVIEAVRAGRFDVRIAVALYHAPDRRGAAKALRECVTNPERRLTEDDRHWAATVFAELDSREDVPLLESWSASSTDASALLEEARALMRLGSRKGVDMLVRIVEEKQVAPAPEKPRDATRLRAEGFHDGLRLCALHALDVVATQSPASGDGFNSVDPPPGPWKGPRFGELDEVAAAVRAWWDASRERLEFDGKAGCWRIRPK
jgi:hypothetical protein